MPDRYVLYGASFSMFSVKLRAYLLAKGLPFEERAPSARTYRRFIVPRTGVAFIPVLHTPDDEVLQDTTVIIDALERRHPEPALIPVEPAARLAALLLELYGDEWLVLPAMAYRWWPPENRAALEQRFGDLLFPRLPKPARRWFGRKATTRFSGALRGLGLTPDLAAAFDAWYEGLLDDLEAHFEAHPYLLGETASLPDFAFAGPFAAHLLLDPAPAKRLRAERPAVTAWAERVAEPDAPARELPVPWTCPETLKPILARLAREQLPVLREAAEATARWAAEQPAGARVPRSVGRQRARIADQEVERAAMTYPLWMLQRIADWWSGEAQASLRVGILAALGLGADELRPLPVRLERRDNRLWLP